MATKRQDRETVALTRASGTGLFSHVLPAALDGHYQNARGNPALTALNEHIALVDGKIFELFSKLADGESPAAWREVRKLAADLRDALAEFQTARKAVPPNVFAITSSLNRLDETIKELGRLAERGASSSKAWEAIASNIYLRKKLTDSEVKRQKTMHDAFLKEGKHRDAQDRMEFGELLAGSPKRRRRERTMGHR